MPIGTARLIFPLLLAGCASAATTGEFGAGTLPAGSTLLVQLEEPIGPETGAVTTGRFTAVVIEPVQSRNGEIVIPTGVRLEGAVTGYVAQHPGVPKLVGLLFDRLVMDPVSYEVEGFVRDIDLALADDDAPGRLAERAPLGTDAASVPGTIIEDAEEALADISPHLSLGTVISLGEDPGFVLPSGTRMRVELGTRLPLRPIP